MSDTEGVMQLSNGTYTFLTEVDPPRENAPDTFGVKWTVADGEEVGGEPTMHVTLSIASLADMKVPRTTVLDMTDDDGNVRGFGEIAQSWVFNELVSAVAFRIRDQLAEALQAAAQAWVHKRLAEADYDRAPTDPATGGKLTPDMIPQTGEVGRK